MSRLTAIGLDIGTTSTSVVAIDSDATVLASRSKSHNASLKTIHSDEAIQSPERHRTVALNLLKDIVDHVPATPVALGVTGQMHGILMVDGQRKPQSPLYTWQDRRSLRSEGQIDDRTALLKDCSTESIDSTGCVPSTGYGGITLSWLKRHGECPENASRMTTISDWLCAELTDGPRLTMDRTHAAAWGIYDLQRDAWNSELLDALEIEPTWLPQVMNTGETAGVITPEIAQLTHLATGLPVCVSIGDNQAAVLGSLPPDPRGLHVNIGTGGQVSWVSDQFVRRRGVDLRPFIENQFLQVGAGFAGGDAYAILTRIVGSLAGEFGLSLTVDNVYELLDKNADAIATDADGLKFRPTFRGTRQEPHRLGELIGMTESNFTLGHLARSAVAGIAEGLIAFVRNAEPERLKTLSFVAGSGNGLRRNRLQRAAIREAFGCPVQMTAFNEEAAAGAAILAGSRHGLWGNLTEARSKIPRATVETLN